MVGKGPRKCWGGIQTRSGKGTLRSRLDRALQGDYERAIALLEEGLALFRELGIDGASPPRSSTWGSRYYTWATKSAQPRYARRSRRCGEPLERWTLAWLTTFGSDRLVRGRLRAIR